MQSWLHIKERERERESKAVLVIASQSGTAHESVCGVQGFRCQSWFVRRRLRLL